MSTVLIVEDEADLAALLRDVLEEAGYEVVLATGTAAVETATSLRPTLILTDYTMPGVSGGTVIEEIRRTLGESAPPIALVTGRSEAKDLATRVGADGFLYKPFDVDDLLALVHRLIGDASAT